MVTTSPGLMLSMRTVYCTLPPGSLTLLGLAVLLTVIDEPALRMVTVALPLPLTALFSSSTPLARHPVGVRGVARTLHQLAEGAGGALPRLDGPRRCAGALRR